MFASLIALASALGLGLASALIPVVNAEAIAAGYALPGDWPVAIGAALALAAGQTVGKVMLYEAGRAGRRAAESRPPKRTRDTRWSRAGERLLSSLNGRWRQIWIVALSSSIGIPPLLATAPAAGMVRMRRADFIVCCFAGRAVRFLTIVVPVVVAVG